MPPARPPAARELQSIPGIGPSLAQDLVDLGIRHLADLRRRDPQRLYDRLCTARGVHQDRCVLYAFRCAVYYASHARHEPQLLHWWNWSDAKLAARGWRRG